MNVAWRLVKVNELNTAKRLILKHFELGIGILMHLSEMMITSKTRKGPQKIKGNIKSVCDDICCRTDSLADKVYRGFRDDNMPLKHLNLTESSYVVKTTKANLSVQSKKVVSFIQFKQFSPLADCKVSEYQINEFKL